MQIDQLHRQLKSDPDNVELARQLWNLLLREQIPAELADIDVTDPSPKNWKAILRLVNDSSANSGEVLIEVLKPLLRSWPAGSRPIPLAVNFLSSYSLEQTLESGASRLCDSVNHSISASEVQRLLSQPDCQLQHLTFSLCETSIKEQTIEIVLNKPLRYLISAEVEVGDPLYNFVSGITKNSTLTRRGLEKLKLTCNRNAELSTLFQHEDLRENLKSLDLCQIGSELSELFLRRWQSITALSVELDSLPNSPLCKPPHVNQMFPNLEKLVLSIKSSLLTQAIGLETQNQRIDINYHQVLKSISQLINGLDRSIEFRLEVEVCSEVFNDTEVKNFLQSIANRVTDWRFNHIRGYFSPEFECDSATSVELTQVGFSRDQLSPDEFAGQFCEKFSRIDSLKINDSKLLRSILSDGGFRNFTRLKTLDLYWEFEGRRCPEVVVQAFKKLKIHRLTLTIVAQHTDQLERLQFPKTIQHLQINCILPFAAILTLLKSCPLIDKLSLSSFDFSLSELKQVLRHPKCQHLRSLHLDEFPQVGSERHIQLNSAEFWREFKFNEITEVGGSFVSQGFYEFAYDHWPKFLHARNRNLGLFLR